SYPITIVVGPDGALWFTELMGNQIGRITTDGAITELPMPGLGPVGMVVGPDGAFWFAAFFTKEIVRVTPAGVATHRAPVPSADPSLLSVAVGPDGNIWYTSQDGHKVGRVAIASVAAAPRGLPRTGGAAPRFLAPLAAAVVLAGLGWGARRRRRW